MKDGEVYQWIANGHSNICIVDLERGRVFGRFDDDLKYIRSLSKGWEIIS